ncbi:NACHT domain-containing protein [Paraburkholderia hospita]|nr:NACHT domain-containing protein [Paraburkholderia hospita]SEI19026.1 NACHT domain-containing protein [Paraburkholderia hospita]
MTVNVLIAHASGEEDKAELLARPIREAGYTVSHSGTVLVGDSVVAQASTLLAQGGPVVVCGTVRAMGTRWARQVASAARNYPGVRVFVVQMEEDADTDAVAFEQRVALYHEDPRRAAAELITALSKSYPLGYDAKLNLRAYDLESRYRELALKACDIIDLANLPEDDRHLASRELELRRLYVALRMHVEVHATEEVNDETLLALESRRTPEWGDGFTTNEDAEKSISLGERLAAVKRLVVLGDPGAGKSTLLRWIATAYLLRLQNAPDWSELPDIASLPDADWLPILIRCRDLPANAGTLEEMLHHSLRKSELSETQCEQLKELLRSKVEGGTALLLVDGLDEITEPAARMRFAAQLEQVHRAFPDAPMVVTSRIVGYREMGYKIRSGFEHLTVADLTATDKDDFAQRWCDLTERPDRRVDAARELSQDIHSSDRIERLTGNPMLLTTMALVKRKIGRLPQRRVDLYEKAVEVLLNWRSAVDAALDPREALPQLEYLAHAMCADGVQQLREDQALELLRQVRNNFPHIHALQQHSPEDFLRLLERRTGLLMQSGHKRHNGLSVPVYEFRHLTLQEYLAGIALVQGHYRGRDKSQRLEDVIAPLAGEVGQFFSQGTGEPDVAVVENWREPLRLCVAACNDDIVDSAILAILRPLPGETGTARARLILAALCLADEPNVSTEVGEIVLNAVPECVEEMDGNGLGLRTGLGIAAHSISQSRWATALKDNLLDAFLKNSIDTRSSCGGLYGEISIDRLDADANLDTVLSNYVDRLRTCDEREAAGISLTVMVLAYENKNCRRKGLADALLRRVSSENPAVSHAAAWALGWMSTTGAFPWKATKRQLTRLIDALSNSRCDTEAVYWIAKVLRRARYAEGCDALISYLPISHPRTRAEILETLGKLSGGRIEAVAQHYVRDSSEKVRRAAMFALSCGCADDIDQKLMRDRRLAETFKSGRDPAASISLETVKDISRGLALSEIETVERLKRLSEKFDLKLKLTKAVREKLEIRH